MPCPPSLTILPDVAHHDIDKGVLDEREEDKKGARGHEHVNCLLKKIKMTYMIFDLITLI